MKRHLPLALATAAIIATLIGCTWSIERHFPGLLAADRTVAELGNCH